MITAILISLWAYLFCGPLSEPDQVFGWAKAWAYKKLPDWLFMPVIGCAKCHAGQAALWYQVVLWLKGGGFSFAFILCSIFSAILLVDFHEIREKWKH